MGTEEWLEEALVTTNRLLHVVPSSILQGCVRECRRQGVSLEKIANVSHQLGLVDTEKLAAWKEAIPNPGLTLPSRPEVSAFKQENKPSIERFRFLAHYLIGTVKEIPVALDWQPDENVAKGLSRVLGGLMGQVANIKEKEQEEKNGNSNSNSA